MNNRVKIALLKTAALVTGYFAAVSFARANVRGFNHYYSIWFGDSIRLGTAFPFFLFAVCFAAFAVLV
jgi:hypothetical protein